jgi:membrane protein DedA with SNARE-associated domain
VSFQAILSTYGYAAIALGTFFEGETILVLAGFATHRGYLELPWVIFCGFLGTLGGDQFFFYLGRIRGMKFLEKRSQWQSKAKWVADLLNRHPSLLVFGFRFLYGLRSLTPFLLGASGFSPSRFLVLNSLGAFLWAVLIGLSGYLFGHIAQWLFGGLERYELHLFLAIAALGVVGWAIHWFRKPRADREVH